MLFAWSHNRFGGHEYSKHAPRIPQWMYLVGSTWGKYAKDPLHGLLVAQVYPRLSPDVVVGAAVVDAAAVVATADVVGAAAVVGRSEVCAVTNIQ